MCFLGDFWPAFNDHRNNCDEWTICLRTGSNRSGTPILRI